MSAENMLVVSLWAVVERGSEKWIVLWKIEKQKWESASPKQWHQIIPHAGGT